MEIKPWHQAYPEGIPTEIDTHSYESVLEVVEEAFSTHSALDAYVCMDKTLTFAEIDQLSLQFAAYLQSLGLKKGDRISLQMPNMLQYPVALFGAMRAGLIIVNTNPLYTEREMAHQFKDSGAKAIVILANFADKLQAILPKTDIEHVIITEIGDLLGGFKGFLVNFVVKYIRKMVPAYSIPQAISFKKALKLGSQANYQRPVISYDDVGFLQYTGGTTGISKGATLSHGNVVANMLMIKTWNGKVLIPQQEVIVTALPLYHIFAFTVNCLSMLSFGGKNILITNPRDMTSFLKDIRKHPFTVISGVNTLFNGMMNHPDFPKVDWSHLKIAVGGGMAVQNAVNDRWKQMTGVPILEGYGLSETAPVLTTNPTDGTERIGTIGLPMPNTDLKIMDEQGQEVAQGERGEICAKGPQVMQGYWERPEETQNSFFEGEWFRTGDIGVMEADGFFRIVDRMKDMILVSGFNVYPNEVEEVVSSHPGVLECAAIGIPDPKSTEAVKIFVVKKDPGLEAEALIQHCRNGLAGYKVPRHVEFRDELPKSNVGKIIRRLLKETPEQS